jgi:hypothetical protein
LKMITGEAQSAAQSSAVQLDALWCFHGASPSE